jgi:hypothetical protein
MDPHDKSLRATQTELQPGGRKESRPVFSRYSDKPVLLKDLKGNHHIVDGHHRLALARGTGKNVPSYVFHESEGGDRIKDFDHRADTQ